MSTCGRLEGHLIVRREPAQHLLLGGAAPRVGGDKLGRARRHRRPLATVADVQRRQPARVEGARRQPRVRGERCLAVRIA